MFFKCPFQPQPFYDSLIVFVIKNLFGKLPVTSLYSTRTVSKINPHVFGSFSLNHSSLQMETDQYNQNTANIYTFLI